MFFAPLFAAALAASSPAATADTIARKPRPERAEHVVREFEPVTVVGGRRSDRYSAEAVHPVSREQLRRLPVDNLAQAIGLQAGVVAVGEDLHVRGGRAGELATTLAGISLNESSRSTPMEVPLFAVRSAELLSGGLDADHGGSLAGELDLATEVPGERPEYLVRWVNDGRYGSGFDAAHVRLGTPLGVRGLGLVAAGEARLDDLGLPSLRTRGRTTVLGRSFGWRQENHLLAWAKLAPVESPQRWSFEVLTQRTLREPYDPMFSFDGWTYFESPPNLPGPNGGTEAEEAAAGTWVRYRAADHKVMTEDRRWAAIATANVGTATTPVKLVLARTHARKLTSVGLRPDPGYIVDANRVLFGAYDRRDQDPFHAIFGDEPYFRLASSERWTLRADASRKVGKRHVLRTGAALSREDVKSLEVDEALPDIPNFETTRRYHATAPGLFAYAQHRWDFGGLVWNGGMRVQRFDPGTQDATLPAYLSEYDPARAAERSPALWRWSPRAGFAYPMSDRDVFSLAYSRTFQDPPRDLLYESRQANYDRRPLGNAALVPAEVIAWQMAIKHILDPEWSVQVAAFARNVYGAPGTRLLQTGPTTWRTQFSSTDAEHAQGLECTLLRVSPGRQRLELTYTFLNAFGEESDIEGVAYGAAVGPRPMPSGERPLDWDLTHTITIGAQLHTSHQYELSWTTRVGSGKPWSPVHRSGGDLTWPAQYTDLSLVNSERFPWSEVTNVALRWTPRLLRGGRVLIAATNLFDEAVPLTATLSGAPNPTINTVYDEYGAYRTETGQGGGAYWNDANGDGQREWVPVADRRLVAPRRSLRLGLEFGM